MSTARSSTTCAAEWGERRAYASAVRDSGYPRPVPAPPSSLPTSRSRPSGILRARRRRKPLRSSPRNRARRLLQFDRQFGLRYVAGVDEAGRGCLAGPLVVAGVLFDYEALRDHRVRPLAGLNDSKQLSGEEREGLFRAVVGCASSFTVRVISPAEIDRAGLRSEERRVGKA